MQLQSHVLNRGAKINKELSGYCLYYSSSTELHILDHSSEDETQAAFLSVAMFFLFLIIAICVPVALYSEALFKDGENSTMRTELNEVDASMFVVKIAKVMLIKTKESSCTHYIVAIFTIAPFLDIGIIVLNMWSLVQYKTWYTACFIGVLIVLLAFNVICIAVLTCIIGGICLSQTCLATVALLFYMG